MKKISIATICIFVCWSLMDFFVHMKILAGVYQASSHLWRPEEECLMGLNSFVVFASVLCFVLIFHYLITNKSYKNAGLFGLLVGLSAGLSSGYSTYAFQAIPYTLACAWFLIALVEYIIGAYIMAFVYKKIK